jgi:hypothetical protein
MKLKSSEVEDTTIINKEEYEKKEQELKGLNSLEPPSEPESSIPFWGQDPNILFHQAFLYELFPADYMSYNQKLNALTRSVLLLTIISIMVSGFERTFMVSLITIGAIYAMHYYHKEQSKKEAFVNPVKDLLKDASETLKPEVFDQPDTSNPFSNVLMNDYDYNPNKKPAPPAFNKNVNNEIVSTTKKMVQEINPDQPNIDQRLFKDLGEEMSFEQSLRPFHSTPNTTIPNDQKAFTEFCYGSMVSCKEGNPFACARNLTRHTNY